MAKIYVALNGDDVGKRIGEAIASDDHDSLQDASSAIKSGHSMIEQWAEARGGRVVTSSGDEGIFEMPEEALQELESIRASYKDMTGHSLTVGIDNSMSEASKALVYGKLNDKDQIVEYEPSIDDYIANADMDDDEDMEDESSAPSQEELPSEEDVEGQVEDDEVEQEGLEGPEHEEDMLPEEEAEHDIAEQEEDEEDSDIIEADQEAENVGNDGKVDEEDFGTDPEQQDDITSGDPSSLPAEIADEEAPEEEMAAAPEDESEMAAAAQMGQDPEQVQDPSMMAPQAPQAPEEEGESPYDEIAPESEEEQADPAQEAMSEEPPMEGSPEEDYDHNDALTDMVYGHMEDGEEIPEGSEEADNEEALKSDIASALMAFKDNKAMLEAAKNQSPELYQAVITMLSSMIDMAHRLGYSSDKDMEAGEAETDMREEFPEQEGDQEEPDAEDIEESEEDEREMPETIDDAEDDADEYEEEAEDEADEEEYGEEDPALKKKIKKSIKDPKALPDKATKHVARKQALVGAVKDGRVKIMDGDTQTVRWRQGLSGMSRDWDGDPESKNYNQAGLKPRSKHSIHEGKKRSTKKQRKKRQ